MTEPTIVSRLAAIEQGVRDGKSTPWTDVRDLVTAIRKVHDLALDWDLTCAKAGIEASFPEELYARASQEVMAVLEEQLLPKPQRYLSGPPGSSVPQYESGPVPSRPEGGEDCPSCGDLLVSDSTGKDACINPECEASA